MKTLPVPETFVDKNRKKLAAQINGITAVKTDIARSLAASAPPALPTFAVYIGKLLFGLGMPPSGNAVPVMNGLYSSPSPGDLSQATGLLLNR